MKILDFESYKRKLLLEADGDEAAEPAPAPEAPAEPAEATPPPPPPPPPLTSDAPPMDMGSTLPPDPNAPVAAPTGASTVRLAILDPDKKWHIKYSNGGGVKRYSEYEIAPADVEKWITDSGLTDKAEAIRGAISGKAHLSDDILDKLKKSLNSKSFGKNRGDIDITFDEHGHPSTNDLDLIFIKSK